LAYIVDWSSEWVFVDVMKSSRFWISQMVQEYYSETQRVWSTGNDSDSRGQIPNISTTRSSSWNTHATRFATSLSIRCVHLLL
jgi:hypothetical protein